MKNILVKITFVFLFLFGAATMAEAQIIVKVRPAAPVIRVRPAAPTPRHVWVTGDYVYRGGQYVYTDGYWAVPAYAGAVWVDGHWRKRRGGWVWIPGHWRR